MFLPPQPYAIYRLICPWHDVVCAESAITHQPTNLLLSM